MDSDQLSDRIESSPPDPAAIPLPARIRFCNMARWRRSWIVLLLALFLAAPAIKAETAPIVQLEPAVGHAEQSRPLNHPKAVDGDRLAGLLASLSYEEPGLLGRTTQRNVFADEELDTLVPLLVEALAEAGPAEQIRFASFSRRSGLLGQQLKTEAVAFIDSADQFNLAFTDVHTFAGPDEDYFEFLALSNHDPLTIDRHLLRLDSDSAAWSLQSDRPLWTLAELSASAVAPPPPELAADEPEQHPATAAAPTPTQTPSAEPADHEQTSGESAAGMEAEIRQRLEFLKALYDDGLISEAEYEEQRREALRRLD